MMMRQIGDMDAITAYPAAADYAARRIVTPPKPAENAAPFTPNQDGPATPVAARKPEYLEAKPDQVKNRETDEQVTRQRVQDKFQGTMFDLRA